MLTRRLFLAAAPALVAAPAIVRVGSLMPVKVLKWNPYLTRDYVEVLLRCMRPSTPPQFMFVENVVAEMIERHVRVGPSPPPHPPDNPASPQPAGAVHRGGFHAPTS